MEISISKVVRWIVGLLFLLLSIGWLLSGQFAVFLISLLIAIICIPVISDAIEKKLNFSLTGPFRFVVVLILFIGMSASMPHNTDTSTTNNVQSSPVAAQASSAQPMAAEPSVYKVGDRVTVGDIAYTITNMRTVSSIGDQYTGSKANGIYVILTMKIENTGKDSMSIASNNVKLIDSQGRSYEGDSTAWVHLTDNIVFKQIQPGLPVTGEAIFDVPTGSSYNAQVSDLWSNNKLISIGTV